MKFALRSLALQVYEHIAPSQLIQPTALTEKAKQTTRQLAESLQLDFLDPLFSAIKKKDKTAYIHSTQSCAVTLADKLQYYIAQINQMPLPKTVQEECIAFYKIIEDQLLHLLRFQQKCFTESFNTEQKMPDYYHLQTQQYFLQAVRNLEKQIPKGISPQIIQLLTKPIKDYYHPAAWCQLSYGRYQYWEILLSQLQVITGADNNAYIQTLILHNFNHGSFINHVMETWYQPIKKLETAAEKIEYWATCLRAINRLHPIPAISLYKHAPTCKQLLLRAIEAEITIQETKPQPPASPQTHCNPIQTTLSVTQLAGMIRLLVDTGIVTCDNQSALLKDISRTFTTRQQKTFSPESLRQKYYNQDTASISILKTHLSNMMGQLRNY